MATLVQVPAVVALVLVRDGSVLVFYPGSVAQRAHAGRGLQVEALHVAEDVLVEGAGGLEVVRAAALLAALVGELLVGVHPAAVVNGGVVAQGALLGLLLFDLRDLDSLDLLHLVLHAPDVAQIRLYLD